MKNLKITMTEIHRIKTVAELKVNNHTYMQKLRIRIMNLDFQAYEKYINIVE